MHKLLIGILILSAIVPACDSSSPSHKEAPVLDITATAVGVSTTTAVLDPKAIANAVNGVTVQEANNLLSPYGVKLSEAYTDDSNMKIEAKYYDETAGSTASRLAVIELNQMLGRWSYLFFIEEGGVWSYSGSLDLPAQRSYVPVLRFKRDPSGETRWLVVNVLTGYGTGLFKQQEVWYRISGSSIHEDLRYVVKSTDWMSPSEFVFSQVNGYPSESSHDGFAVEVEYHIDFTASNAFDYANEDDAHLFHAVRKIKYQWDDRLQKFELARDNAVYGDETLLDFTPASMLRNYSYEIEQLGKSTLPVKLEWLKKLKSRGEG